MFKHSIKVPRLYKVASKVAKEVHERVGSIKQLVYDHQKKHPNIKAIYALVSTLFQKKDEIETLLKRSQVLVKEPRLDSWLVKILMVELLWGKKSLPGTSKPENTIRAYEQNFKAHLSDITIPEDQNNEVDNKTKPRYVRVNTLLITVNEAIDGFRDEGWNFVRFLDKNDYKSFLETVQSLKEDEFMVDIHISSLLIFPPGTTFYNHPAYKNGSIILQDKASCLPVHILGPPPGSIVLDMCAAPGMKTTQLAAALKDEGVVFAVERDPRRFEILNKIVASSKAECVKTFNKDALSCSPDDFPGVQYIVVDPSCSGSGMTDRSVKLENMENPRRIEKLVGFQVKILRSAITNYPSVKKVVYSTCSIFPEENEDVVRQVLEATTTFKLVSAKSFLNDAWANFGSSNYGEMGKFCLYANPNEDLTNGFFVAVFERLEEGETNQFFNRKVLNFTKYMQNKENRNSTKIEKRKFKETVQTQVEELHGRNYQNNCGKNEEVFENIEENKGNFISKDLFTEEKIEKLGEESTQSELNEKDNFGMKLKDKGGIQDNNVKQKGKKKTPIKTTEEIIIAVKKVKVEKSNHKTKIENFDEHTKILETDEEAKPNTSKDKVKTKKNITTEEVKSKESKKKKRAAEVAEETHNEIEPKKKKKKSNKTIINSLELANDLILENNNSDVKIKTRKNKKNKNNSSNEINTMIIDNENFSKKKKKRSKCFKENPEESINIDIEIHAKSKKQENKDVNRKIYKTEELNNCSVPKKKKKKSH